MGPVVTRKILVQVVTGVMTQRVSRSKSGGIIVVSHDEIRSKAMNTASLALLVRSSRSAMLMEAVVLDARAGS